MKSNLFYVLHVCTMDVRFKTPANFYVCGHVRCMLRHLEELFDPVPTKIIYCYGEYQKEFDEFLPNVEFMEGFPNNVHELTKGHDNSLIVLDDPIIIIIIICLINHIAVKTELHDYK